MNQYEQEKQDLKEQPQNTIEAAKKNQYCTKPFDSENSRPEEADEPCENSER